MFDFLLTLLQLIVTDWLSNVQWFSRQKNYNKKIFFLQNA